jgi:hypothetical protein
MEDEAQETTDPKLLALTKDPMTRLALLFLNPNFTLAEIVVISRPIQKCERKSFNR